MRKLAAEWIGTQSPNRGERKFFDEAFRKCREGRKFESCFTREATALRLLHDLRKAGFKAFLTVQLADPECWSEDIDLFIVTNDMENCI